MVSCNPTYLHLYNACLLICVCIHAICIDPTTRVARRLYLGNLQGQVSDEEVKQGWNGMCCEGCVVFLWMYIDILSNLLLLYCVVVRRYNEILLS